MTKSELFKPVNLLLVFFPISTVLALVHGNQAYVFVTAALAIVPIASVMGEATSALADRLGPQWGGLLNATFGNAVELIIGLFALRAGYIDLTRASIIGSVISNLLLVLGASALAGGLRHRRMSFNAEIASSSSVSMLVAVAAIMIPAVFVHSFHDNLSVHNGPVERLSLSVAALMIVFYASTLVFTLRASKADQQSVGLPQSCGYEPPPLARGIAVLATAAMVVSWESELLVRSVHAATTELGFNQVFVGIVLIPIIGNAAEHATAVVMAMRDRMDVAVSIAVGSSIQVAMFVAPILVLAAPAMGHPLSIVFPSDQLVAVTIAAIVAAFVISDGKTHWHEGAQLLVTYAIIALSFFFLPG